MKTAHVSFPNRNFKSQHVDLLFCVKRVEMILNRCYSLSLGPGIKVIWNKVTANLGLAYSVRTKDFLLEAKDFLISAVEIWVSFLIAV